MRESESPESEEPAAGSERVTFADSLQGVEQGSAGMAPSTPSLERGSKFDRYVILNELGRGGMGVVYAAYDPELDRKVAVKLLHTDSLTARARLMREAKAVARLNHPSVVGVHDVGTVRGRVFVAMQLVEGVSLRQWLQSRAPAPKEVLRVLVRAGQGLAAAHAAGLVHRDFKPENILINRRGDPTVLDFGIARRADTISDTDDAPAPVAGLPEIADDRVSALTRADSMMGTPAYMAPEQHAKEPADARSDQFAFCVVGWEALCGRRPFAGESVRAIAENVLAGRMREPPPGARMPGWVRRVLTRGLSRRPEDRYLSMDRLLAELAHDPAAARRRWLAVAAVTGVAATGLYGTAVREPSSDPCAGANERLAGVWDAERQEAIESAFLATNAPYARDALEVVGRELEVWSREWAAVHEEACRATHVHHEQSAKMLDLRMACLNRRLAEVAALTELFSEADASVVANSVVAVTSRGRLEACSDVQALVSRVQAPEDPEVAARVAELHDRLGEARALELGGRYDEALREATEVAEEAELIRYLPLQAEARERLGAIWEGKGDFERSEQNLLDAVLAAEESRAEEIAVDAWTRLVWVAGVERHRPEQGRVWGRFARAALGRLGDAPFREATLTHNLGGVYYRLGELDQAFAHYEQALAAQIEILGAEDPTVARTLNHLGNVLIEKGELERAHDYCRRSLELREKVLGERHPLVAASLNNMAAIRLRQERANEARALVERSLAIVGGSGGPEELVASVLVGRIDRALGRHIDAVGGFRRALALREATFGERSPQLVGDLWDLGLSLIAAGQGEQARPVLARAAALAEGSVRARLMLENVVLEVAADERPAAHRHYEQALELLEDDAAMGPDERASLPELARARAALGLG